VKKEKEKKRKVNFKAKKNEKGEELYFI